MNKLCKAALLGTMAFGATSAEAGTVTFAQFVQFNAVRTFGYVNQDTVSHGVTTPSAELISLVKSGKKLVQGSPEVNAVALIDGVAGSGIHAGDIIKSKLTLDASSSTAANQISGSPYTQVFAGSLSLIDIATGQNLLTGVFTNSTFSALVGSNSATFDANSTSPNTLTFTSSVFEMGALNDLALSITGLSNKITDLSGHSFNYKNGTQGSLTGTFSTSVPEPATVALLGLGMGALGLRVRRRIAA